MKTFITTGRCKASENYMVNIDHQVGIAARMVREGKYFCINRGRQYGKTTTLLALKKRLEEESYAVFSLSFQSADNRVFDTAGHLLWYTAKSMQSKHSMGLVKNLSDTSFQHLVKAVSLGREAYLDEIRMELVQMCRTSKVVLIIDEVDEAGNYPGFVRYLGVIRDMYLVRDEEPSFQSVILSGVYDIKNLKLKMRPEDQHQYNSPWNIASPFDVDMSLPVNGIAEMLEEYSRDHAIDMDVQSMAQQIFDYTSGYPYLVSRLCQIIDEQNSQWDDEAFQHAVNTLLKERNTLFDDMVKKLDEYPELWSLLRTILFAGKKRSYSVDDKAVQMATMFNIIKDDAGSVAISCRLMETRIYNYIIAKEENDFTDYAVLHKNQFVSAKGLDMRLILEKFVEFYTEEYSKKKNRAFLEDEGRSLFILFLRPIINGVGNYYIEAQTRDERRTDIIVDYLGQRYVIELKIWHGKSYNNRGEHQLSEYLDYYHQSVGYMVSFNFNEEKRPGLNVVQIGEKLIVEAVV